MESLRKSGVPMAWFHCSGAVSYTHLDVYKRQTMDAVMAKNPKNVKDRLKDGRLTLPTGPGSAEGATAC